MAKSALQKAEKKQSLNIKITPDLDARLKAARREARNQGFMFNVSHLVEEFLKKEVEKVEKELREKAPHYDHRDMSFDFEGSAPEKEPEKVSKSTNKGRKRS